jgi:hypothetical protein
MNPIPITFVILMIACSFSGSLANDDPKSAIPHFLTKGEKVGKIEGDFLRGRRVAGFEGEAYVSQNGSEITRRETRIFLLKPQKIYLRLAISEEVVVGMWWKKFDLDEKEGNWIDVDKVKFDEMIFEVIKRPNGQGK